MSAWIYLVIGIVFEVVGTTSLKLSNGFSHMAYAGLSLLCFAAALYCVAMAVKTLDISTVYAIWSGVGIALITLIGVWYFAEAMTIQKAACIALIVIGVVGLKWQSDDPAKNVQGHDQSIGAA